MVTQAATAGMTTSGTAADMDGDGLRDGRAKRYQDRQPLAACEIEHARPIPPDQPTAAPVPLGSPPYLSANELIQTSV